MVKHNSQLFREFSPTNDHTQRREDESEATCRRVLGLRVTYREDNIQLYEVFLIFVQRSQEFHNFTVDQKTLFGDKNKKHGAEKRRIHEAEAARHIPASPAKSNEVSVYFSV